MLERGRSLSSYGVNADTCDEITLFAVFSNVERQPTLFRKDVQELGLGENIYSYVQLNKEDKELVAAREYFSAPLFPWLQKGVHENHEGGLLQTIRFSEEDDFADTSKTVLSVHIQEDDGELEVTCTNMAGDCLCSVTLAANYTVAELCSNLCEKLDWNSMRLWDGSASVPEGTQVSKYSMLTAEQVVTIEHVSGCYQRYERSLRPAGYSSSSTSLANLLVLEPGRAGLQYHFKGDYKRAEELRRLVMTDARWFVEDRGEGEHVVQIAGKAELNRYWVHERCGPEGTSLRSYECFALVTIPLQQLEQGQGEEFHYHSTEGSGWTCGSEQYHCSFYLPTCLLNVLRVRPDGDTDTFVLRQELNSSLVPDYPYNLMALRTRIRREAVVRISSAALGLIKYFRQKLTGRSSVTMGEIMQLQVPALEESSEVAATTDD